MGVRLDMMRPRGNTEVLPCMYHTHGGGMAFLTAGAGPMRNHQMSVAARGICVIAVEFRNSAGGLAYGPNAPPAPFPAGINDCMTGLVHIYENKARLRISTIVTSGESGGGNLCVALALLAKRQGRHDLIDGVYACCPFVSGSYTTPPPSLLSFAENDYRDEMSRFGGMCVSIYTSGQACDDPIAWPLKASVEDLEGLPPTVISVNEVDPLRDEGLELYRLLRRAGVTARATVVIGTGHAQDLGGTSCSAPFIAAGVLDSLCAFVK